MPATLTPPETAQWLAMLGLGDVPHYSVISITLSNEPIEHWFYKRNKLRPESLKLELLVPSTGGWRVDLARHDKLFQAQWRLGDDLSATAISKACGVATPGKRHGLPAIDRIVGAHP